LTIIDRLRDEFSFLRGNYLVLVFSWIFMDFAGEIPGAYYALYVKDLKGTEPIIGMIGFASFLALASVQFPGGYLADKFGRRWLVSSMTFGVALSYIFYAVAPSWEAIFAGALIQNFCLIYQPALMAMVSDSLTPERRGMGISIIQLIASVATTPGPAVAALLYGIYGPINGMRISYGVVVVLFLIAAALRSGLKETIKNPQKISAKELLSTYPTSLRESFKVWAIVPRAMFFLFLANLLGGFSFTMISTFTVVYAVEDLGLTRPEWALVLMVLFIAMIAVAFPVGKFIDKIGRKVPLLVSYIVLAPAVLLFVYGDLSRLLLAMPLLGLGQLLMFSSYSALTADLVPKDQRGKVVGFTQFFGYIAMAVGILAGGILFTTNHQFPFLILLAFLIPQFVVTLLMVHEPEKREE
jgi:MFS family permease